MSIVVTLRGASDLKKGQGRACEACDNLFLHLGASYIVCLPCGNSSSCILKIMYFYVYYTSMKIKIEKIYYIIRKKDIFSKREKA